MILFDEYCGVGKEPLVAMTYSSTGTDRHLDTDVWASMAHFGASPAELQEFKEAMTHSTSEIAADLLRVLLLMAAANSPFATETSPMLSRQERRALERQGRLPQGPLPTVSRISLNGKGREHMAALSEEERRDLVRRRAHWVRGHLMNTPTKGPVWRNAHVRGFGEINDTVRVVKT